MPRVRRSFTKRRLERSERFSTITSGIANITNRYVDSIRQLLRKVRERENKLFNRYARNYRLRTSSLITKLTPTKYGYVQLENRLKARVDSYWETNYSAQLPELCTTLAKLSINSYQGLPPELAGNGLIRAFTRHYYCPANSSYLHGTICAVAITPLTLKYLKGLAADFFIMATTSIKNLVNRLVNRSNPVFHLFEYLKELLRRKPRRERFRKKRKGHFGFISKSELIHTVYTSWLEERRPKPLGHLAYCSYCLKQAEAQSIGLPEQLARIEHVHVIAVINRKTITTRKHGRTINKLTLYERFKRIKRK